MDKIKVTISSGIKVQAEMYRVEGALIGVEFNGIFFDESTDVHIIVEDKLTPYSTKGIVLKVFNNRAVIRLYTLENALVWDMIYK